LRAELIRIAPRRFGPSFCPGFLRNIIFRMERPYSSPDLLPSWARASRLGSFLVFATPFYSWIKDTPGYLTFFQCRSSRIFFQFPAFLTELRRNFPSEPPDFCVPLKTALQRMARISVFLSFFDFFFTTGYTPRGPLLFSGPSALMVLVAGRSSAFIHSKSLPNPTLAGNNPKIVLLGRL